MFHSFSIAKSVSTVLSHPRWKVVDDEMLALHELDTGILYLFLLIDGEMLAFYE